MKTCLHCDRPTHGKGMCRPHLRRFNKGLPLDVPIRRSRATDTLEDRFWDLVIISEHGAEWIGSRQTAGYGQIMYKGKFYLAHRLAWELFRGPIPEGEQVDHALGCPASCVTVAHLSLHSASEHTSLGWERGELAGWNAQRKVAPRPEGIERPNMRPRRGRLIHDG